MAKTVGNYPIPFDTHGNQVHYPSSGDEWRDNDPFTDTLKYTGYSRGRSAAYFNFVRANGTYVTVFLKDFEEMIPYLVKGEITGTFRFVKRGENYGCALAQEK